jgi:hypothetical protein
MIKVEVVERRNGKLMAALKGAMRSGSLKTFYLARRGQRVKHRRYKGMMSWKAGEGVVSCRISGVESWQFLRAFIGRLSDRFSDRVESVHIEFPAPAGKKRR